MLTYPKSGVLPQDGFLVLPGALDADACAEMRDRMWAEISAAVPRLDRNDSKTWGPFTADESPSQRRPEHNNSHEGGDVRFECGPGHRYTLRNGADDFHLDFFPRALWDVAEQLLGRDELTYPRGEVDGKISGPCFMDAATESGLATHTAREPRWPPPLATEELEITKTGPGFMNGQGTRGLYCTMPNSNDPREVKHSDGRPYAGMHSVSRRDNAGIWVAFFQGPAISLRAGRRHRGPHPAPRHRLHRRVPAGQRRLHDVARISRRNVAAAVAGPAEGQQPRRAEVGGGAGGGVGGGGAQRADLPPAHRAEERLRRLRECNSFIPFSSMLPNV